MNLDPLLAQLAAEEYCYVTTTGRVTGKPHRIEIWFGLKDRTLYLLSGGMDKSDWVRNMRKHPAVKVRIGRYNFLATSRAVTDGQEERTARLLLAEKYREWENGNLSEWARTAFPVALDLIDEQKS